MSANIPANTEGGLLTPQNCAVAFIDHQLQMTFGVANIDRQLLMNNVVLLAKCAKLYVVPAVLTAVVHHAPRSAKKPHVVAKGSH